MKKLINIIFITTLLMFACTGFAFAAVQDVTEDDVVLSQTSYVYSGQLNRPTVTIDGLVKGTDFTVKYLNHLDAGTATAVITGKGAYTGMYFEIPYTIEPQDIEEFNFEIYANRTKTTFYAMDATMQEDVDYTYSYEFDSNGYVIMTVQGIGNYTGICQLSERATYVNYLKTEKEMYQYRRYTPLLTINNPKVDGTVYTSSNTDVAEVSESGEILSKNPGTAVIKATNNKAYDTIKVTVMPNFLSSTSIALHSSFGKQLTYTGGSDTITWKSTNESVATVTAKGYVKGRKAGSCYVTASRNGVKLKCKVKVYSYYSEVTSVPDFGAYIGKVRVDSIYKDKIYSVKYNGTKNYASQYEDKLKASGFTRYFTGTYGNAYIKDKVYVYVKYNSGVVTISYSKLWGTDKSGFISKAKVAFK